MTDAYSKDEVLCYIEEIYTECIGSDGDMYFAAITEDKSDASGTRLRRNNADY